MPTLTELADVAMIDILERCDFKSLMTLRQVCKSLRDFISNSHLKTDLNHICVFILPCGLQIRWVTKSPSEGIPYESAENFTSDELRAILSIQNSKLDTFQVGVNTNQSEILEDLEDILKSKPRPLQAGKFAMSAMGLSGFMQVLPYLDSKTIELSFAGWGGSNLNRIEKLLETEQFKMAEVFKITGFVVRTELSKFFHLQECDLNLWRVSEDDLKALKEAFCTSPHMRDFTLQADNLSANEVEKIYGSPSWDSIVIDGIVDDGKTWFFKMEHSNECVLEMKFRRKKLYLRKVEKLGIPNNAIIIRV